MNDLGRLEDLPEEYREALSAQNLVPLWPSLRGVMPENKPRPHTKPTYWKYASIKPLLLQAGELTPIEKAERRVLVLANPGHTLEKMQASAAIYLGMQLLLPGEWAPSHRHTPNAIRMIVEGEGAYTTVEGEKCMMSRGDLVLTPSGTWHEHGHDGKDPVIWLDVLDLPLVYYMEASYHNNTTKQENVTLSKEANYRAGGVVPTPMFERYERAYPMYRYPWVDVKKVLEEMGQDPQNEVVQVTYVNPETGDHAENILGFYALMLRPGQEVSLPVRSPASVFHVIEGGCQVQIEESQFELATADTCCAPGYSTIRLKNASISEPAFLFMTDETPLHRKLGVYEIRV